MLESSLVPPLLYHCKNSGYFGIPDLFAEQYEIQFTIKTFKMPTV